MSTSVEVIGVYPIETDPHVHLIELLIRGSTGVFDMSEFTQESLGLPTSDWQVAYDEQLLDEGGENIVANGFFARDKSELWSGSVRLIFFFHYLNLSKPLKTPFGDVALPKEGEKPERLSAIRYEPPC